MRAQKVMVHFVPFVHFAPFAVQFPLPARHLDLILQYVRWAIYQELASTQFVNPDPTSLAMCTFKLSCYSQCNAEKCLHYNNLSRIESESVNEN
jgi:hypothetical protein